jgi:transcriptional adapter 2-alpha
VLHTCIVVHKFVQITVTTNCTFCLYTCDVCITAIQQLLADMKFSYDDTEESIRMKHDVVRMYNARIEKRRQKKEFIAQHRLFDYKDQALADKKRHPDDNDLVARLRPLKRLRSADEHDEYVDLIVEKQQLQRYC